MKLVPIRTDVAVSVLLVMTGCGGSAAISVGQDGGGAGRGALNMPSVDGDVAEATSTNAACDHYFAAQYLRCGGPRLPADELARIEARFELVCAHEIALPGSGVGAATLEACAAALDLSPRNSSDGPPAPCDFRGALPSGAACTDGLQCASGACNDNVLFSPEGPTGPRTCGTCAVAVATGQVCAHADFSASCSTAAICLTSDTTAALPTYTCTAIGQGDVDAPCDDLAEQCKPGLFCSAQTGQCARLGAAGAPAAKEPSRQAIPAAARRRSPAWACRAAPPAAAAPRVRSASATPIATRGLAACRPGRATQRRQGQVARFGCSASGQCAAIHVGEAGSRAPTPSVAWSVRAIWGGFAPARCSRTTDGGLIVGKCPVVTARRSPPCQRGNDL